VRHALPNGLTLLVEENRAAPVVAIQVWMRVGSADERLDEAGLAHLHEHMLFKGTARRGPGEVARSIEASGGEINAWTSFDGQRFAGKHGLIEQDRSPDQMHIRRNHAAERQLDEIATHQLCSRYCLPYSITLDVGIQGETRVQRL